MLRNGCSAPQPGEIMKIPTLAKTFRTLASEGKDGFYKGRIATEIVNIIKELGGHMTLQDLERHSSTQVEPISITFEDELKVYECPPNGQGLTALMALGIIEQLKKSGEADLRTMEHTSAEYLHIVIEALRVAFSDTRYYVADPDVVPVPINDLLSSDYLCKRAELISKDATNKNIQHGFPVNSSDTVYFSVVDKDGNACSFIISNYEGFGTGIIPKGCGFTLQNVS